MKRKLFGIHLSLILVWVLSACAAPAPTATPAKAPAAKPAAAAPTVPSGQKELIVMGFGGAWEKAFKDTIFPAFEKKYGVMPTYVTGASSTAIAAKIIAQKSSPEVDVFFANNASSLEAEQAGVVAELDPARTPNLEDLYAEMKDRGRRGAPWGIGPAVIVYNTKVFQEKGFARPTSWYDLWKPEFKGKVVFGSINIQMTYALLPLLAKLEAGDSKNIDAALSKVKAMVPNILTFYGAMPQTEDLFKQGAAWIGNQHLPGVVPLKSQGFPVDYVLPKEGSPYYTNYYMIPKGAPHFELAQEFVNFAISAESQAMISKETRIGPTSKSVKLDPDVAKDVVYGPEQVAKLVQTDYAWLNASLPAWTDRWNKEIEQK